MRGREIRGREEDEGAAATSVNAFSFGLNRLFICRSRSAIMLV